MISILLTIGTFITLFGDAVHFDLDGLTGTAASAEDFGAVGISEVCEIAGEGYGLQNGKVALGGDMDGTGLFNFTKDIDPLVAVLFYEHGDLRFYEELREFFCQ